MASERTKSISTKMTPRQYARLAELASPHTISEWARGVLLRAVEPDPMHRAVLAELIALRTVLFNLHFALANGHRVSVDQMQSLIDRADGDKWIGANERLAGLLAGAKK